MKSKHTIEFFESMLNVNRAIDKNVINGELHKGEFFTLKCIGDLVRREEFANGLAITLLSKKLHVSAPAMSQMINGLEKKELVIRTTTKQDRRIVYVDITEEGEAYLKKSLDKLFIQLDDAMAKMGEEDANTTINLLKKIETLLKEGDKICLE